MKKFFALAKLFIIVALLAYFIIAKFEVFYNILLVIIGFGAVIFIHELGHFSVGKLTGMNVQAFCLGFHPLLIGVLKTEKGFRVRILPKFFPTEGQKGEEGDGILSFTIPVKSSKPGETEYRIGIVPFGGFVKVLGQEDVGVAEVDKDPRSFINKPVWARIAMVSAGVIFNAISAIIIFMITFMIGVDLPPAVVGDVMPDSPAAVAGMQSGDKIIEINGVKTFDFGDVMFAGPLSGENEPIHFKLQSEDGTVKELDIIAKDMAGQKLRGIGITSPTSLAIGKPQKQSERDRLLKETSLKGGDVITAVNGEAVSTFWQFTEKLSAIQAGSVKLTAKRIDKSSGEESLIETNINFDYLIPLSTASDPNSETQLGSFYSMLPRLKIPEPDQPTEKGIVSRIKELVIGKTLQPGDVIINIAGVDNPTFKDMRDQTQKYENMKMPITVLRKTKDGSKETLIVYAKPKLNQASGKVMIGIPLAFDFDSAVVAKTVSTADMDALAIPAGAMITKVADKVVSNFTQVVDIVRQNKGSKIEIEYTAVDGQSATAMLNAESELFSAIPVLGGNILFQPLRKTMKAANPAQALAMGWKKTSDFIITTYITLKQLFLGLVSPSALSGPIGIVSISYKIVSQQSIVYYLYFMALISACIAVFNFLPLPVMDGGIVVMLIIEKLKGSPISHKVQGVINYVGLILILGIFVLVTFNDIKNIFMQ